jgi:hypothetical protein
MLVVASCLLFIAAGCRQAESTATGTGDNTNAIVTAQLDGNTYRLSGPYTHENVAVFLLHAADQDERNFLTLDEGLKEGLVKIAELDQERVGSLQIDNQSDRPLYLQEGERLQGGKQDRIIIASLVISPKSGPTSLPTNCVEQGRWVEGAGGKGFGSTANLALAPKGVRGSAKIDGSQEKVWECVKVQKENTQARIGSANSNTSINETLDSPQALKLSAEYAEALSGMLSDHPDAVGAAVLINGAIEEVNIYPNHSVLARLYPRLINSYALQAVLLKDGVKAEEPMTLASLADFLQNGQEKSRKDKALDSFNKVAISELDADRYKCTTEYENKVVHRQILKKSGGSAAAAPRAAALGSKW